MPREITDRDRVVEAVKNLVLTAELCEEQNGKPKYAGDLEVIVHGRDYGNGKKVGPYLRLLACDSDEEIMRQGEWGGNTFYITVTGALDVHVSDESGRRKIGQLEPGSCFGEMAVLAGIERNATISVPQGTTATVLEVSRPALRLLRKLPKFGQSLDETYRAHGFSRVLEDFSIATAKPLSQEIIEQLREHGRFMVYGKHHVLCREGTPIDKLILIKNGWVRRSKGVPFHATSPEVVMGMGEHIGVDFFGEGNVLGLEGLSEPVNWKFNATLMARSEVLELPLAGLDLATKSEIADAFSNLAITRDPEPRTLDTIKDISGLRSAEEEIATGVVDGTNLLVMDMDLCVRCGNCSLACHKVHGQSRLVRRGIQIKRPVSIGKQRLQHALLPQVCMHCKDPECLTGCPTGAIFRDPMGFVDINVQTCIGCFDCATQCPYDAIAMVPRQAEREAFSYDIDSTRSPEIHESKAPDDVVAIKCNLCDATPLNPKGARRQAYSCEENCPTGALVRVDPTEYFSEISSTQGFVFKTKTHALGRNIHKSDPLARAWNFVGAALVVAGL